MATHCFGRKTLEARTIHQEEGVSQRKRKRPKKGLRFSATKHIFTKKTELAFGTKSWRSCVTHIQDWWTIHRRQNWLDEMENCTNRGRYEVCFHEDDFRTPLYIRGIQGIALFSKSNQHICARSTFQKFGRRKFTMWVTSATRPIFKETDESQVVSVFDKVDLLAANSSQDHN